jgi:hypothetical protein
MLPLYMSVNYFSGFSFIYNKSVGLSLFNKMPSYFELSCLAVRI